MKELTKALAQGKRLYLEWDEKDGRGKTRHIENPEPALKHVQRRLGHLLMQVEPPHYLYCPAWGRDYLMSAKRHAGAKVIRSLDIKDFHPSTPARRVYWFFHQRMRCGGDIAGILAALTTYEGHLPTGAPTSSILAFYTFTDMWEDIEAAARSAGCTLTVYGDDITLSGDDVPERVIWDVKRAIFRCGLRYHKEKQFFGSIKTANKVIIRDGKLYRPNRQLLKLKQIKEEISSGIGGSRLSTALNQLRSCEAHAKRVESFNQQPPATEAAT